MKYYEDLKEMLCEGLEEIARQGEIDTGSLDVIDKLTHSLKSLETIMAMEDYSGYDGNMSSRNSYARRGSVRRNARGRYSRDDGRSMMAERIESMMDEADSPAVRDALKRALQHIDE